MDGRIRTPHRSLRNTRSQTRVVSSSRRINAWPRTAQPVVFDVTYNTKLPFDESGTTVASDVTAKCDNTAHATLAARITIVDNCATPLCHRKGPVRFGTSRR